MKTDRRRDGVNESKSRIGNMHFLGYCTNAILFLFLFLFISQAQAQNPGAADGAARFGSSRFFTSNFTSTIFGGSIGNLSILLPEGYNDPENSTKEYNVLFTFDGNQSHYYSDAMEELARQGLIDQVILVGVPAPSGNRNADYGYTFRRTADCVADEILPYIRSTYRVKSGVRAIAVAGHSLGGHVAFATAWYRYDKIGGCAAHSGTASVSYHWGYDNYNTSSAWAQFSQRPMGDEYWSGDAGTCVDIRYWPAYDNSGGTRKANLRLFIECGVTEYNNTASRADSAGDWAAVANRLLAAGWNFGENVAHYDNCNYRDQNLNHFYSKQESAAWSSLYFLFRKADLTLTSVQIIPKRHLDYIRSNPLSNANGHQPAANRIDMRRGGSTTHIEMVSTSDHIAS